VVKMARRVGVWAVAIFAAGHVSGCALAWLATARADDVTTYTCEKEGQTFVYDLPDDSAESLARLTVVTRGASGAACGAADTDRSTASLPSAVGGRVTLVCPTPCTDGRSVTFAAVLR